MPIVGKWKLGYKLLVGDMPAFFCFASHLLGWRIIDQCGLEFGLRALFSTSLCPAAHVKGHHVLGMCSSP